MPILAEFHESILVVKIVDGYSLDEYVRAFLQSYKEPRFVATTAVLVDARQSDANPSSDDLHRTGRRIIAPRPADHSGKWAIVAREEPLRFGIARMGALTLSSMGVPMEVFTDLDAALSYLKAPERAA